MKYQRIYETNIITELNIIKLSLNELGIEYRILFENSLNIGQVTAMGGSGAIIEVVEKDIEKTKEALIKLGIKLDNSSYKNEYKVLKKLEEISLKIPILNKLNFGNRFFIISVFIFLIIASLLYYNIVVISKYDLIGNYWCVDSIINKGKIFKPNYLISIKWRTGFGPKCEEQMYFNKSGEIELPGGAKGNWKFISKNKLKLSNLSNYTDIFEGEYKIEANWKGTMKFISKQTTIQISHK